MGNGQHSDWLHEVHKLPGFAQKLKYLVFIKNVSKLIVISLYIY